MNEHVKVLEQMRASGFDYDFDNEQYAALDAAIAALKAEKPGWVMVPAEPTQDMVDAAWPLSEDDARAMYATMLAAAQESTNG